MEDSDATEAERSFTIAPDDLDELEVLAEGLRVASQSNSARSLFEIYQRIKHIIIRTRGYFEE